MGDETAPPEVRYFEAGETMIQQGGTNDEVYTLIEGSAEALVDGVKVGDIKSDEIFGAIAAIAGVPRTASVVATSRCMAISLPKGDFLHLLKSRPSTVLRLIQDMARALASANDRVVGRMR
jgi:CRP-like cAMP-binding protein